jgi:hypothetical protein
MRHIKRGEGIPGTDVTHFFDLSLKVGQRGPDYRGVSMREINNGSPGWIRTPFSQARQNPTVEGRKLRFASFVRAV